MPQTKPTFLTLPAEIRNKIYTYILVPPTPIIICQRTSTLPPSPQYQNLLEPPLLYVNHQIRHESLPIFYSNNIFFSALRDPLIHWLKCIGAEKRKMVRCIRAFSATRYFDFEWSWGLVRELNKMMQMEGVLGIEEGVVEVPFGVQGWEGMVFWMSYGKMKKNEVVRGTEVGVIEGMGRGTKFKVTEGKDGRVEVKRRDYEEEGSDAFVKKS